MTTSATEGGVLLKDAVDAFEEWIGDGADHHILCGAEDYVQPFVYLSFHLISMRAAGWDTDFDELGVVSGASALFGHQPRDFMCKYAHLEVDPDRRITEATGFGYEWVEFADAEGAWDIVRASVKAGKPVKGWDWENVLFVGYRDAAEPYVREVFVLADGPGTYARWWDWSEWSEWVMRMQKWKTTKLGRFAGRVEAQPAAEVAKRVLTYLVAWSEMPPASVQERFPAASFGLAGMAAYAANCANVDQFEDWTMCHDVNGQWTLRNSTAVWLRRLVEAGTMGDGARVDLGAAADSYRAAYEDWGRCYGLLGHGAGEAERRQVERRREVASLVRHALRHERQAVSHLRHVLEEKTRW